MKYILLKLIPGVAACLAVCLVIGMLSAQASREPVGPAPAAAVNPPRLEPPPQVVYATAAAPAAAQLIVCGHCGEQVSAPQTVLVAMPLNAARTVFSGSPAARGEFAAAPLHASYHGEVYRPGAPPPPSWEVNPYYLPPSRYAVPTHYHNRACGPVCRY